MRLRANQVPGIEKQKADFTCKQNGDWIQPIITAAL